MDDDDGGSEACNNYVGGCEGLVMMVMTIFVYEIHCNLYFTHVQNCSRIYDTQVYNAIKCLGSGVGFYVSNLY